MVPVLRTLAILAITCYPTSGYSRSYTFDSVTCWNFSTFEQIGKHDWYDVYWYGDSLDDPCVFTFDPIDSDDFLCVEAKSYNILDCNTTLHYYGGSDGDRIYSCYNHKPSTFCGNRFRDISIQLKTSQARKDLPNQKFHLKIYAMRKNVGLIVGLVVTGAVVVFVCLVLAGIIASRGYRRRMAEKWLLHNPTGGSQPTGYTNPNYHKQPYPGHAPTPYSGQGYNATSYPEKS